MNTGWYIHTATLYQLSCRWIRDDIYIPQLYINFPADKHPMIYRYRNFISIFQQMNSWWYIHTGTLYQFSSKKTLDDIYILQLYINFPADDDLIIYTYRNFVSIFLQLNTLWYIHTAALYQFPCRWTRNDIYIPQLYINFPADEHLMIYTYRNLISIFQQMNTWWCINTATLYQLSCSWTPDDIYIPQLYIDFPADEHVMIYIYTATLYQLSCGWTRDDIYIRNFISTFLRMNTGWYIYTGTLY